MLRTVWYFVMVLFANGVVMAFQFWQVKNARHLGFLGYQFSSIWTFWAAYTTFVSLVYWPVNYLFFYLYWHGYTSVFPGRAWHVQETFWLAMLVCMLVLGWLFFAELPARNAVSALFFLACAFAALVWR